jgi:hypothetical protein
MGYQISTPFRVKDKATFMEISKQCGFSFVNKGELSFSNAGDCTPVHTAVVLYDNITDTAVGGGTCGDDYYDLVSTYLEGEEQIEAEETDRYSRIDYTDYLQKCLRSNSTVTITEVTMDRYLPEIAILHTYVSKSRCYSKLYLTDDINVD